MRLPILIQLEASVMHTLIFITLVVAPCPRVHISMLHSNPSCVRHEGVYIFFHNRGELLTLAEGNPCVVTRLDLDFRERAMRPILPLLLL
jgi:hypothetical protein